MVVRTAALLLLGVVLWTLFRFAMGLRSSRIARESARRLEESRGRRLVGEIPQASGDILFFSEDGDGFYWGGRGVRKSDILGVRLLLNGGVMAASSRVGTSLPQPASPEEYEGKERWDVALYLREGQVLEVPCASLREGVSRDIARAVFQAVREALSG